MTAEPEASPNGEARDIDEAHAPTGPGCASQAESDAMATLLAELVDVNTQLQRIADGVELGNKLSMLALSKLDGANTPGPEGEK